MAASKKQANISDSAAPERRASQRLAADLLRFEKAFEQLERSQTKDGSAAGGAAKKVGQGEVDDYLGCLDEAIKQIAEEFAADDTIAKLVEQRKGDAERRQDIAFADDDAGGTTSSLRGPMTSTPQSSSASKAPVA
jgi:hypothetical protein